MVALEDAFQTRIDEGAFSEARDVGQLRALVERAATGDAAPAEPVDFPAWNRSWSARAIRRVSLPTWILPLARVFAWMRVEGREHLARSRRPGDLRRQPPEPHGRPGDPGGAARAAALPGRAGDGARSSSRRISFPQQYGRAAWFTNSLNYYLAALFFNAFPLPQREAGARQTLRYIGEVLDDGYLGADLSGRPPDRDGRDRSRSARASA